MHEEEGGNGMTCPPVLEALVDGELDATQQARALEHIESCIACKTEYERLQHLQTEIRERATYFHAPDHLLPKITQPRAKNVQWQWFAAAASILLAISLAANLWLFQTQKKDVTHEVFTSHMRSLMGTHLFDVASSDRHTVKPWFTGKLDFSPNVKDLAADGFPLSGGRVDYISGRPVAALVFHRGGHVINLYTWPSANEPPAETSQQGFNIKQWTSNGMTYWAISDIGAEDLQHFAQLYGGPT